jgi:hypothetical protein
MKRLPDWRSRLLAYIETHRRQPFQYGVADCATFAAGAVEAMTGVDPAAGFRGYTTFEGGIKRLRQAGINDHIAMAAKLFRIAPHPQARMGDLAVLETDDGPALGVVGGSFAMFLRPDGLGTVDLMDPRIRRQVLRV